ncbi:MAG: hypothetical protein KKD25_03915 [Gammaproteobacteria bacterium]|jgi:hypothetical protein|nr:hypothetical protein [Gammaproteobacteria bacterium]MBU0771635.1 hypothetical protein [Gammaproteobacteria bacterium]MBU0856908.1 hypothetical protein [Gammaproteobacteria bacterium]MBU1848209.1 hypothetical protein [Gammaproteobacteria bacterium]
MNIVDLRITWILIAYTLGLALLPLALDAQAFAWTFSEAGPFEQLSIAGWLFTALLVLVRIRPLGLRALAFSLLCFAFAAREADWHKAFTGESFLKNSFYRDAARPFQEKLVCALVAMVLVALVLYAGFVIARFLFLRGGWRSRSGAWLMAGTALVIVGKLIDRLPAVLSVDYGIELAPLVKLYASAFEEGLEMAHPLILAWSVWLSQIERRYLS